MLAVEAASTRLAHRIEAWPRGLSRRDRGINRGGLGRSTSDGVGSPGFAMLPLVVGKGRVDDRGAIQALPCDHEEEIIGVFLPHHKALAFFTLHRSDLLGGRRADGIHMWRIISSKSGATRFSISCFIEFLTYLMNF